MKKTIITTLISLILCTCFGESIMWKDTRIDISTPAIASGSKFTLDEYNRVYYAGSDGKVYVLHDNHWTSLGTPNSYTKARSGSDLLSKPNYLYYVGRYGYICYWYWNGSTFTDHSLTNLPKVKAGTSFTEDNSGRIYFVDTDGNVCYFTRSGSAFSYAKLNNQTGARVRSNSNIVYSNNHIYYVNEDDEIASYWWNSSYSGYGPIDPAFTNVKEDTQITLDEYGRVFWVGTDDIIRCAHYQNGSWGTYWWAPEVKVDEENGFIYTNGNFFYTRNNYIGTVFHDGTENKHTLIEGARQVKDNTYFITDNKGALYYFSTDGKVHTLSPQISWVGMHSLTYEWDKWTSDRYVRTQNKIYQMQKPFDNQLYQRQSDNYGIVAFEGYVSGVKNISIRVTKTAENGSVSNSYHTISVKNDYFKASIKIHAELAEYDFALKCGPEIEYTPLASKVLCGDIFLLGGQSNAQSSDNNIDLNAVESQFGYNSKYSKYNRTYSQGFYYNYNPGPNTNGWGKSRVTGDWAMQVGVFATYLQYLIQTEYKIPTCILNGGIGGTSIDSHLPIAGDNFYFKDNINGWFSAPIQGFLNAWVYHADAQNNLKGFIWWQGESDVSKNTAPGIYKQKFAQLYNTLDASVTNNFNTYIMQVHSTTGSVTDGKLAVPDDQRTMASALPGKTVRIVSSNGLQHINSSSPHFTATGYRGAAQRLLYQMGEDFYGEATQPEHKPLELKTAFVSGQRLNLVFDQEIDEQKSDNLNNVLKFVHLSKTSIVKSEPEIDGNIFSFKISASSGLSSVSYGGTIAENDVDYPCHLRNKLGMGALTCAYIPIEKDIHTFPFIATGSTTNETDNWDVTSFDGADKAYKIYISEPTLITATTCQPNTDYDTKIEIFKLNGSRTGLYNDDKSCTYGNLTSTVTGTLSEGYYYVVVDGYNGKTGSFGLSVSGSSLKNGFDFQPEAINTEEDKTDKQKELSATVTISPVPADKRFSISGDIIEGSSIQLISTTGKMVAEQLCEEPNSANVQTEDLDEGVYFVKIQTSSGTATKRIVVKH